MLNTLYHSLNPIAFQIGVVSVRWYGLAYITAFIIAGVIVYRVARHWKLGITSDDVLTLVLCVAFGVIIGARAGYCIFYGAGDYIANPLKVFALSDGGMSFHGGLCGALVGAIVACRLIKVPFLTLLDLGAIAGSIGLFFGRCANFINGELWGAVTTLPWGVVFDKTGGGPLPRHPSQLYEAFLEGIVIFTVLFILSRKRNPPRSRGTFFATFLVMYGAFRILIEFVRQPDQQLGYLFGTGWVTMGMCLSLPLVLAGITMLVICHRKALPQLGRLADACVHEKGGAVGGVGQPDEGPDRERDDSSEVVPYEEADEEAKASDKRS